MSIRSTRLLGGNYPTTRLLLVSGVGRILGSYRSGTMRRRVLACKGPSLPIGDALVTSIDAFIGGLG